MPRHWVDAFKTLNKDSLHKHGTVPWTIQEVCYQLTEAFKEKNIDRILKLSSDLGHYCADSNVPLHSTHNYNGQFTDQIGIHGLWESRLPELFAGTYQFWVGRASYENDIASRSWQGLTKAHSALDSVLSFEKTLNDKVSPDRKYGYEQRGSVNIKTYSKEYSNLYHNMLNNQVERQLLASIKMTADLWYTCWINAGQPDLPITKDNTSTPLHEEETKPIVSPATIREEVFNTCPQSFNTCSLGCCGY